MSFSCTLLSLCLPGSSLLSISSLFPRLLMESGIQCFPTNNNKTVITVQVNVRTLVPLPVTCLWLCWKPLEKENLSAVPACGVGWVLYKQNCTWFINFAKPFLRAWSGPWGRMFDTPELEICDGYVIVDLNVESLRKVSGQHFFLVVFLTVAAGG